MKIKLLFQLILLFSLQNSIAQITIDGNITLESQTTHDSVLVFFKRIVPSYLIDSTYSDINGAYSISLEKGVYNITLSKKDYVSLQIASEVPYYSNQTLSNETLELVGLNGPITGRLTKGIYKVGDSIEVPENGQLIIEAGTQLKFSNGANFNIKGVLKAIGTKEDPILFTRLNKDSDWKGIYFSKNPSYQSIISHATIEYSTHSGIIAHQANPTLEYLTIQHNKGGNFGGIGADGIGGGIALFSSNGTIRYCDIKNNNADLGAGIFCHENQFLDEVPPTITNTIIHHNTGISCGGIFFWYRGESPKVNNCVISNNIGKSAVTCYDTSPHFSNTIISFNQNEGIEITSEAAKPLFKNCTIFGNKVNFNGTEQWLGNVVDTNSNGIPVDPYLNIQVDPLFINADAGEFGLQENSPCIDAGINDSVHVNLDFSGNNRIWDGNQDQNPIVDIGAFEYNSTSIPFEILATSEAQWIYSIDSDSEEMLVKVFNGDTVINNQEYTKIYIQTLENSIEKVYSGAFRQNTQTGELFYTDTSGIEHNITMDLTLEIGDTISTSHEMHIVLGWSANEMTLILESIDTIQIDDQDKIGYTFKIQGNESENRIMYITGIGFILSSQGGPIGNLFCFTVSSYNFIQSEFCNITGVSKKRKAVQFSSIHPNPTNGTLIIKINSVANESRLIVRNSIGQKIDQRQLYSTSNSYELNSIPGFYFIEIYSNQKREIHKIVKY